MPGTEIANDTVNRGYPLPYPTNKLSFDVARLILALQAIDVDVAALFSDLAAKADLLSPEFSGVPLAPTAASTDDSNQIATTAFVQAVLAAFDTTGFAPIASPLFTGDPRAPTRTPGDNSVSIATTAFVEAVRVALINGAPAGLDTLDELAAAIGDDPAYATNAAASLDAAINLIPTWFTGMELGNNAGNLTQNIDIKAGSAKNGLLSGTLASVMTKQSNLIWAEGSNAGFLEATPKQSSKTYFVYCIRKNSNGALDFIASVSATEAGVTVPAGWTMMVRIGIFITNSSGNNIRQVQRGNDVLTDVVSWFSVSNDLVGALSVPPTVPIGLSTDVMCLIDVQIGTGNADAFVLVGDGDSTFLTANPQAVRCRARTGSDYPDSSTAAGRARTNDLGQLYRVADTSTTVVSMTASVCGWRDWQSKRLWG